VCAEDPQAVRVTPGVEVVLRDGTLTVVSSDVRLPLRPRSAAWPGTGVRWKDGLWEVVRAEERGAGGRWVLEPWPQGAVARDVFALDRRGVESIVASRRDAQKRSRLRLATGIFAPVLGFLPGRWQARWQREWGYPAAAAVTVTALLEILAGAAGMLDFMAGAFGGGAVFPGPLHRLGPFGGILLLEGAIRLREAAVTGEPIGSLLGAWLLLPGLFSGHGEAPVRRRGSGVLFILRSAAVTVPAAFAPPRFQEIWARRLGVPPILLTLAGAVPECWGGLSDLARSGRGGAPGTVVSLVILADGLVRLVLAATRRGPVGSLFGLPLNRLYERLIGEDGGAGASRRRSQ